MELKTETSPTIGALAKALAAAQGEVEGAAKDSTNPHFRSQYADLASIFNACRKALSKNGLAIVQTTEGGDPELVTVATTLAHESGEWIRGYITIRPSKADAQGIGSAITYARRYSVAAMVGVAPEDDDGNAAAGKDADGKGAEKVRAVGDTFITEKQEADLLALMEEVGADNPAFCDYYKIEKPGHLPAAKFARAVKQLEAKRKAQHPHKAAA